MRRFLLYCVWLSAGYGVINVIYLLTMREVDWNFNKSVEAAGFNGRKFKVLVFGNSTALDGINTEMLTEAFGDAYNFAVGGATLQANWLQLEAYLRNNERPERVLLFLSNCHLNYKNQMEVNPVIAGEVSGIPGLKDIPLYKFRWLFVENFKKVISSEHRRAKLVRGQLQMTRTVKDVTDVGKGAGECLDPDDYLGTEFEYLWRMENICRQSGIQFHVFEMPCWKKYQDYCEDVPVALEDQDMRVHNLNRLNVCEGIILPEKHWLSENHLNYSGSVALTAYLVDLLRGMPVERGKYAN